MTAPVDGRDRGPRHRGRRDSSHGAKGMDTALLGMLLFIASEVMFFAALFGVYFNVRATTGLAAGRHRVHQLAGDAVRPGPVGAHHHHPRDQLVHDAVGHGPHPQGRPDGHEPGHRGHAALGIIFLCLQVYEYYTLVTHDDFGINSGVYGSLFYTMTGFHGAHVLGGVIGLAVILARGMQGQFSAKHHVAVEAVHYYWHFVDIVWVVLFLTIYVLR